MCYPNDGLDELPIETSGVIAALDKKRKDYNDWFNSLDDEGKYKAIENETYYAEMLEKNLVQ